MQSLHIPKHTIRSHADKSARADHIHNNRTAAQPVSRRLGSSATPSTRRVGPVSHHRCNPRGTVATYSNMRRAEPASSSPHLCVRHRLASLALALRIEVVRVPSHDAAFPLCCSTLCCAATYCTASVCSHRLAAWHGTCNDTERRNSTPWRTTSDGHIYVLNTRKRTRTRSDAARCMLRVACCALHAARCTLMLRAARCMLHAERCMLHVSHCMLHVDCCMLHVACFADVKAPCCERQADAEWSARARIRRYERSTVASKRNV
jgi:hypothetical protein